MDYKMISLNLIEKYRDFLLNDSDYVKTQDMLEKLDLFFEKQENGMIKLNFDVIESIAMSDVKFFKSSATVSSLKQMALDDKWKVSVVINLIKKLEQEILENKANKYIEEKQELDRLYDIISNDLFIENYLFIIDFINKCVENKLISLEDAMGLNFYILRECSVKRINKSIGVV